MWLPRKFRQNVFFLRLVYRQCDICFVSPIGVLLNLVFKEMGGGLNKLVQYLGILIQRKFIGNTGPSGFVWSKNTNNVPQFKYIL